MGGVTGVQVQMTLAATSSYDSTVSGTSDHRSTADMFGAGATVGPGEGAVCDRPLQLRLILPLRRIYWQQNRGRGL